MPRRTDRRIDEIEGEQGEWFVYLKPGYAVMDADTPRATHSFGAATKGEVRRIMSADVTPCRCGLCVTT